jgi:non-specific serine/threonine protein kinase
MPGGEYLSPDVLHALWQRLTDWALAEISREKSVVAFLQKHAPAWSRVGRVTLHHGILRFRPLTIRPSHPNPTR